MASCGTLSLLSLLLSVSDAAVPALSLLAWPIPPLRPWVPWVPWALGQAHRLLVAPHFADAGQSQSPQNAWDQKRRLKEVASRIGECLEIQEKNLIRKGHS